MTEPLPPVLNPVDEDQLKAIDPSSEERGGADKGVPAGADEPPAAQAGMDNAVAPVLASTSVDSAAPVRPVWLGLAACLAIALMAEWVASTLRSSGMTLGALTLALLFGVLIGNLAPARTDTFSGGISFAKKHLLRIGIVLYGFRLTLSSFQEAGVSIFLIDALVLTSTFVLAMWFGVRVLKMDAGTAALVGAGSSICGASAVLASAPIIGAKPTQASIAISTVAVFGTIALLLYPILYRANLSLGWLPGGDHGFGVFIGSTVHEVGQVVAISSAVAAAASDSAVVTKMGRVAMLLPFLFALAYWHGRGQGAAGASRNWHRTMPWYPVLFALVVVVNSFAPTAGARPMMARLDELALATAMVGLGLSTRLTALREAGPQPLMLAGVLFVWLVVAGGFLNVLVPAVARFLSGGMS